MESYLQGQYLWEIVDGNETTPPSEEDAAALRRWKIKVGKAMFAMKTTILGEKVCWPIKQRWPSKWLESR
jgi:hypothetical protein